MQINFKSIEKTHVITYTNDAFVPHYASLAIDPFTTLASYSLDSVAIKEANTLSIIYFSLQFVELDGNKDR